MKIFELLGLFWIENGKYLEIKLLKLAIQTVLTSVTLFSEIFQLKLDVLIKYNIKKEILF